MNLPAGMMSINQAEALLTSSVALIQSKEKNI